MKLLDLNWKKGIVAVGKIILVIISFCIIVLLIELFVKHFFISYINKDYHDCSTGLLEQPYYYGGILSGIFSGLAFAGVVYTLIMQKRQSDIQKRTSDIQRFETTFFNMLNLHQEITNGLSYKYIWHTPDDDSGPSRRMVDVINGRNIFEFLFHSGWLYIPNEGEIKSLYEEIKEAPYYSEALLKTNERNERCICSREGMKCIILAFGISAYEKMFELPLFDHYFRHLYHILKFVDGADSLEISKDDFTERYKYASILRATLSPYELVWLFYNGISCYGNEKFKPLIERYSLLKNIREDLLVNNSKDCEDYRTSIGCKGYDDYPKDDFDFFSTIEKSVKNKYHLSAFYSKDALSEAIEKRKMPIEK